MPDTASNPAINYSHEPDLISIRLLKANFIQIGRGWNAQDVCDSFWRLYVNSSDGASLRLGPDRQTRHRLAPGRLCLIPAGVWFTCRNSRRIDHLYLHFELPGLPVSVGREIFDRPMTLEPDGIFGPLVQRLRDDLGPGYAAGPAAQARAKALAFLAVAQAIEALDDRQRKRCFALLDGDPQIAPALRHIDSALDQPITNADLAERCCMSEDHFIRRFKAHLGQTPARFVVERRVAAAANRLAHGSESIEQIALALGFPDRFYFTRVFTKHMGVPPAAYRRRPLV